MYDDTYGYPSSAGGRSQPERTKVGRADENFPAAFRGLGHGHGYAHSQGVYGAPQDVAGPPYYPPEMAQHAERRPLQPMQLAGPLAKAEPRQQQLQQQAMYHGHTRPAASEPFGLAEPMGFMGRQGLRGPQGLQGHPAYHPQDCASQRYLCDEYPQEPPLAGRFSYDAGLWEAPGARAFLPARQGPPPRGNPADMHCDPPAPPPQYSGFTPKCTSSPVSDVAVGRSDARGCPPPPERGPHAPLSEHGTPVWSRPLGQVAADHKPATIFSKPGGVPRASGTSSAVLSMPSNLDATAPRPLAKASASNTPSASSSASRSGSPARGVAASPSGPRRPEAWKQERGLRVITGTVDNVLVWGRKLDEEARPDVLFEILGSLDSVARGPWYSSRLLSLRSLEGSATLSAVFWEIDRPLCPPPCGSVVSCVCRLGPKWPAAPQRGPRGRTPRLQVLRVRAVSAGQVAHLKRLAFVSGHAVQQGALAAPPAAAPPAAAALKQTLISQYASPSPAAVRT